jgi:hypothetical protein
VIVFVWDVRTDFQVRFVYLIVTMLEEISSRVRGWRNRNCAGRGVDREREAAQFGIQWNQMIQMGRTKDKDNVQFGRTDGFGIQNTDNSVAKCIMHECAYDSRAHT